MLVRVFMQDDNHIVFEAMSEENVKDKLYLSGGEGKDFRIGVVVIDSKSNLVVEQRAEEPLRRLFKEMPHGRDSIGDIDWYKSDNKGYVFSWIGPNRREFDLNNLREFEQARGSRFQEGEYILAEQN